MTDSPTLLTTRAHTLGQQLIARHWQLVTAESCTGGWIAKVLTDSAGSSAWFDRGFVTYSNAAKTDMLGVPAALIARDGAVSPAVVRAMAIGALHASHAQMSVAVSGIAGPGGGSATKPVGMVCLAWGMRAAAASDAPIQVMTRTVQLRGDRAQIRAATVRLALARLLILLKNEDVANESPLCS
ncbi:nicotinamide-nucleotide amidohydrolase family protein [Rhodoferax sp. 4810]|uniref:Nicotinamide-nucleotide amidohydrolase family protein n=1 Tax=Thiospirillum jenense TaxID=1653858 RepID=A0A839H285_9GAMM|nr:nicotinamide-nucleotide amidohydrolase family protein [Thiospirillum jenense]MBB1073183.1 nicotinamide-nucleotide amidohydrolase family protein [Rhodoferax jenense]MBB1124655.1 nicotinamide-nucleotide amidohydrolase family protein [Thiospirillum jenense]